MSKASRDHIKVIARNKKAFHNYLISDRYEAGISLLGSEVKSIRAGKVNLVQAFAKISDEGELFLIGCHIAEYPWANLYNHDPTRPRKLLLHRKELGKLSQAINQAGATILPLSIYFKGGLIKVELGLGKGKKLHDKRETLKKRSADRDMEREMND